MLERDNAQQDSWRRNVEPNRNRTTHTTGMCYANSARASWRVWNATPRDRLGQLHPPICSRTAHSHVPMRAPASAKASASRLAFQMTRKSPHDMPMRRTRSRRHGASGTIETSPGVTVTATARLEWMSSAEMKRRPESSS